MRLIPTVILSALLLVGCASEQPGYDQSALPEAAAVAGLAVAMCEKEQDPAKFSVSKFIACRVAAERNFVTTIHLQKMDVFDTYADKMLALAADYDAGRIGLKVVDSRAGSIRDDYQRACDCLSEPIRERQREPISRGREAIIYGWLPSLTPEHP